MKDTVDIRLVQFDPEWLEPNRNLARMVEILADEAADGADLVVFPELSNVGYVSPTTLGGALEYPGVDARGFRDLYVERCADAISASVEAINPVAARASCTVVLGVGRVDEDGILRNSAAIVDGDGLVGIQDKLHIPPQEMPFFEAGSELRVFDTSVARIGLAICYDSRFPEHSVLQAEAGAEIGLVVYAGSRNIVNAAGVEDTLLYRAHVRAQESGMYYGICNRSGTEGTGTFTGRSVLCAPDGAILARGDGSAGVVRAALSASELTRCREAVPLRRDRRRDIAGAVVV